jgi:hypothetical protein
VEKGTKEVQDGKGMVMVQEEGWVFGIMQVVVPAMEGVAEVVATVHIEVMLATAMVLSPLLSQVVQEEGMEIMEMEEVEVVLLNLSLMVV